MTVARIMGGVLLFAALVALHYSLRPLLGWRAEPDFLIIALLIVAVRLRPGAAAILGFSLGIVADALAPGHLGAAALAMSLVGFSASWLKAMFFADNLVLNGLSFFLGKLVFDLIRLVAEGALGRPDFVMQALLWTPLSAAVTAVVGIMILILLRPVLELRNS